MAGPSQPRGWGIAMWTTGLTGWHPACYFIFGETGCGEGREDLFTFTALGYPQTCSDVMSVKCVPPLP